MNLYQAALDHFEYKNGKLFWKKSTSNRVFAGKEAGSEQSNGYFAVRFLGKRYPVHKIVYLLHHQFLPDIVDHINGDRKDNTIQNLRSCTKAQNNKNTAFRKHNTSGAKNIFWLPELQKWRVKIVSNKQQIYCGVYEDKDLAELVAQEARRKYHQEFASHR